jgi:hypothetical protein
MACQFESSVFKNAVSALVCAGRRPRLGCFPSFLIVDGPVQQFPLARQVSRLRTVHDESLHYSTDAAALCYQPTWPMIDRLPSLMVGR